jgi:hypothetical protein
MAQLPAVALMPESLQGRVAQAIRGATHGVPPDAVPVHDNVGECAPCNAAAAAAIRECAEVVRDFPLNICGYGAPMPADHAASVEDFRRAVLAALAEEQADAS